LVILLSRSDIESLMPFGEYVDAVAEAFRLHAEGPMPCSFDIAPTNPAAAAASLSHTAKERNSTRVDGAGITYRIFRTFRIDGFF
jgi:ornithine cyclodeaminase/alanine dehydrogenase-like protein (mu-crystallin family)